MVNMLTGALLATWAGLIVLLYASHGGQVLRRLWFPLVYLLFLIPPPVMLVDPVVQILKRAIAMQAVGSVAAFGIEVAARGSSLFVDQYELLVAAACSGMNSLFSLAAIGIFYVHVRHDDDWRHAALLALAIVPVALGTNLIRVILLLVAVHIWGVRVLETPLHMATGLAMAALALLLLALIDLSVNETLPRTVMTSVTILLALGALLLLGGHVLRGFTAAMILGIVVGTYSSIYVSSSLLITLGLRAEPEGIDKPRRGGVDNAERVGPREG